MIATNRHAELIAALRAAADYLESHPNVPSLQVSVLAGWVNTKEEFRAAARGMGSLEKSFDDNYYRLGKQFGPLKLTVEIRREKICRKVVTWECPDESLLRDLEEAEAQQ